MQESKFKSYEDFPTFRIGNRMVVPKEKFIAWVKQNTKGGAID